MGPHLPDGLHCLPCLVSVSFLVGPALETGRSLCLPELCPLDTGFLGVLHSWLCFKKSILRTDRVCSLSDLQISGQLAFGDHSEPLFLLSSSPPLPPSSPVLCPSYSSPLPSCPALFPCTPPHLSSSGEWGDSLPTGRRSWPSPSLAPSPAVVPGTVQPFPAPSLLLRGVLAGDFCLECNVPTHCVYLFIFLDMCYFLSLKKSPAKGSRGSLEDTKPKYSWFADSP